MPAQRGIELRASYVIVKPLAGSDMAGELAAQIVVEAALSQAGKELARQRAEAISDGEASDLALDFRRTRLEQ